MNDFDTKGLPPEGDDLSSFLHEARVRIDPALTRHPRSSRHRNVFIGAMALAIVAGGGAAVASVGPFAPDPPNSYQGQSERWGVPHGVTPDGKTYGSSPMPGPDDNHGVRPDQFPDLMSTLGDHGKLGYVDRRKSFGWEPKGPCESQVLPVYAEDGKTQIDTFTSGHSGARMKGFFVTNRTGPACPGDAAFP